MDSYKKAIEFYANNAENKEFGNKGADHAAIVVTNLIRIAKKELRIYSGNLCTEVANNNFLVRQLKLFLEDGKKLRLILDELPSEENRSAALKIILNSVDNPLHDVKYKVDKEDIVKTDQEANFKDNKCHHFMVADDNAYRFETDIVLYQAFGNFNDQKVANKLINIFDTFFEKI